MLSGDVRVALDSPFKQSGDNAQCPLLTLPPRQLRAVVLINLQRLLTHKVCGEILKLVNPVREWIKNIVVT